MHIKHFMPRVLTAFLLLPLFSLSQADSLQQEINQQVWKPFTRSFNNLDADGFMSVHSKLLTRVLQDSKRIYGYEKYYAETKNGNESARKSGATRTVELRFIQRIAAEGRAFDIGYFKVVFQQPGKEPISIYGKFHVLLQEENGSWKILMDADAAEKTDEQVFLTGEPIK